MFLLVYYPFFVSNRWSFLIGDEPCTVINKPPKPESPVFEDVKEEEEEGEEEAGDEEEPVVGEEQKVEVIIEVQEEKVEEEEKAEVEATKVSGRQEQHKDFVYIVEIVSFADIYIWHSPGQQ